MDDPNKLFTQADIDAAITAAVAAATAPLQAKLAEVDTAQAASAIEAQIAAAVEPLQTQVADLQAQLDTSQVAMQAEKDRADQLVAERDAAAAAAAEAAEFDSRRTARTAEAKEVAGLTDEYLAAVNGDSSNADRFAAMSDEAWAATVDAWKVTRGTAGAKPPPAGDGPPRRTALFASAGGGGPKTALQEAAEARISRTVDLGVLKTRNR